MLDGCGMRVGIFDLVYTVFRGCWMNVGWKWHGCGMDMGLMWDGCEMDVG